MSGDYPGHRLSRLSPRHRSMILIAVLTGIGLLLVNQLLAPATRTPAHSSAGLTVLGIGFSRLDRPAPEFDLPLLGRPGRVDLAGLAGRPIVVNFWASDCSVCRAESPAIETISAALGSRVHFLGIDTQDEQSAAIQFARRYRLSFDIAADSSGSAAARYGVQDLPMTFFIAATGKTIIGVNLGRLSTGSLAAILHRLYGVRG